MLTQENLFYGWLKVQENAGAGGVDGQSVTQFAADVFTHLRVLLSEIENGDYSPKPLKRVYKQEVDKRRPLSIPCVRDRVVQTAIAQYLTPILEPHFEEISFAYRQGFSVQQAIRKVVDYYQAGFQWVVDADIRAYFDEVPHQALFKLLQTYLKTIPTADKAVIEMLVDQWLKCPIIDRGETLTSSKGIPQGSPLSPLLANVYLDQLDDALLDKDKKIVRFADDFLILCRTEKQAQKTLKLTGDLLADIQLSLNDDKTQITHFDAGFQFLGHQFIRSLVFKIEKQSAKTKANVSVNANVSAKTNRVTKGVIESLKSESTSLENTLENDRQDRQADDEQSPTTQPKKQPQAQSQAQPKRTVMAQALQRALEAKEPYANGSYHTQSESTENTHVAEEQKTTVLNGKVLNGEVLNGEALQDHKPSNTDASAKVIDEPIDETIDEASIKLDPLLRTLYLTGYTLTVGKVSQRLLVESSDDDIDDQHIPIIHLDAIMVMGNAQFSTQALRLCLKHDVMITFTSYLGAFSGYLTSGNAGRSLLHQRQFQLQAEAEAFLPPRHHNNFAREFRQAIIYAKLENTITLLRRTKRRASPELVNVAEKAIQLIKPAKQKVQSNNAIPRDVLIGIEGSCAKAFFSVLAVQCEEQKITWTGRQSRPANDWVNAALNFLYTQLYNNTMSLLYASGLNPYIGYLHTLKRHHAALASDLMEPFRAIVVDSIILRLIKNGDFQASLYDGTYEESVEPEKAAQTTAKLPNQLVKKLIHAFEDKMNLKVQYNSNGVYDSSNISNTSNSSATNKNAASAAADADADTAETDMRRIIADQIRQTKAWIMADVSQVNYYTVR